MSFPSRRAREAIKTALAVTLAYGIALWLDWDKPYWAGFAVAMISLSTAGQSLNKGAMRMLGTLVGAVAALVFLAWFPQDRWGLAAVLSVYVGFLTYMVTGPRFSYFWFVATFVCLIVMVNAGSSSQDVFQAAVLRTLETGLGILVYALVSVLVWPQDSRAGLISSARELISVQRGLFGSYLALSRGEGSVADCLPERMRQQALLTGTGQALAAARTDSYEVWEVRRYWLDFQQQALRLMQHLGRWRESTPELDGLPIDRILPGWELFAAEIDSRLAAVERMLGGESPGHAPRALVLDPDLTLLRKLGHFQQAAVEVVRTEMLGLERATAALFDSVASICGYPAGIGPAQPVAKAGGGLRIDPDRAIPAVRMTVAVWLAFAIWIYVDPPGHAGFVNLGLTFALAVASMHTIPATSLVRPFVFGIIVTGLIYVFIMPRLSGFGELGPMIFLVIFGINYIFWKPQQGLSKVAAIICFLVLSFIDNQQSYSFATYANQAISLMLCVCFAVVVSYFPTSPRPEKVVLRLIRRFFRRAEVMLDLLSPQRGRRLGWVDRWRVAFYRGDTLEVPLKVWTWSRQLDVKAFPDNTPEKVQALVLLLGSLAHRLAAVADTRDVDHSERAVTELCDEMKDWRLGAVESARLWAEDPGRAGTESEALAERNLLRLQRLEQRMQAFVDGLADGEVTREQYQNLYRLLGSYRGLSEAAVNYARQAETINWRVWQEARF
jgi:uncharacterized membrane protein YccC